MLCSHSLTQILLTAFCLLLYPMQADGGLCRPAASRNGLSTIRRSCFSAPSPAPYKAELLNPLRKSGNAIYQPAAGRILMCLFKYHSRRAVDARVISQLRQRKQRAAAAGESIFLIIFLNIINQDIARFGNAAADYKHFRIDHAGH